jgi:hypothetical protein
MAFFGVKIKRNSEKEGIKWKSEGLRMMFWFSVIVQIIDVFVIKYDRAGAFPFSVILYLFIAAGAFFVVRKERGNSGEYLYSNNDYEQSHGFANPVHIIFFLAISAIYVALPFFFWVIPQISMAGGTTLSQWVHFFLAVLPVWPIYFALKGKSVIAHRYVNFVILGLLILFVFGFGTNLKVGNLASIGGRPMLLDAGPVFNFIIDEAANVWKNIINVGKKSMNLQFSFAKLGNLTGLNYYYGMGDKNDQGPVGLYIDNLRTMERYFYEGSPVILWADVRGKSFTEEIRVKPGCYIEKIGAGEPDPKGFSILGEEHDTMSCTFDDVPKGSHRAKMGMTFNFETWSYVTYTFVDQEIKRSLELQGKNINSELDVDMMPLSVYSNGPIMLGMGAQVDQPVGVDRLSNLREPVLGVTIENAGGWTEGWAHVNEFEIQVPNDFKLINCDRWHPDKTREPSSKIENYDIYTFKKSEMGGDLRQEFQSVTCRLHIINPNDLLSGSQKVQRTFVSRVRYDYEMEKSISITVREG